MDKIKTTLCIFFLVFGLIAAFLTYDLSNNISFGRVIKSGSSDIFNPKNVSSAGSGVDSSDDGVAVGLGIISGFSFLSSVLLLTSIQRKF